MYLILNQIYLIFLNDFNVTKIKNKKIVVGSAVYLLVMS